MLAKLRLIVVLVAAVAVVAIVPAAASANWFFSKPGAEKAATQWAQNHYTVTGVVAFCRPQGLSAADSRFVYHRWVCGVAADGGCGGSVQIIGSHIPGQYYSRVIHGLRCDG